MKKILKGLVIKNRMNKTIVVLIERIVKHKIYGKFVKKKTKIHVHDEHNICKVNDFIEIEQSKPISKTKFWIFKKIIKN